MGKSKKTPQLVSAICFDIATTTKATYLICPDHGIDYATFKRWCVDDEDVRAKYARAKDMQADILAEQIIHIADDSSKDTMQKFDQNGKPIDVEDKEWTSRSKLRIDSRKWLASKLKPKKYSEKMDLTSGGEKIEPTVITGMIIKDDADSDKKET